MGEQPGAEAITLCKWFNENHYQWVSPFFCSSILKVYENNGLHITCGSSGTVGVDSGKGITENLDGDHVLLLANCLFEESNRSHLECLFDKMRESDSIDEFVRCSAEIMEVNKAAREFEEAYRMTELYALQFAKIQELLPEKMASHKGR